MRKLGVLATLALVIIMALPLFAVNAQDDDGFVSTFDLPTEPAPDGPLAGVDPSGQTITWWHNHTGHREEWINELAEQFNTENPWGITLEASLQGSYADIYNKVIAGIPTGDVSNLVVGYQNNSAAYYLAGGLPDDMDVYVMDPYWGLNEAEVADFIPGIFKQDYLPDGSARIGFPPNRSTAALYYNKTALEELGHTAPPTTWAEFTTMACEFAEQGWSGYEGDDATGFTITTSTSAVAAGAFALGGTYFANGEFDFTTPEVIEFIQVMVDLYENGCAELVAESYGDQNNFTSGKALFYTGSTSGLPYVRSGIEDAFVDPFEWDVTYYPYAEMPVQNVYGGSVSILKSTPEAELASWLFLRWFTEPAQAGQWAEISGYFPVRYSTVSQLGAMFEDNPQYESAWNLIQGETMVEPQIASYDAIREEIEATFDDLLVGGGDVETAMMELTDAANQIMASFTP